MMEEKKTEQDQINENETDENSWKRKFGFHKRLMAIYVLCYFGSSYLLDSAPFTLISIVMMCISCGMMIKHFPVRMSPKVFVYETGVTKELYSDFNAVRMMILVCVFFLFSIIRSADFSPSPKESASLDSMVERPVAEKKLSTYQKAQLDNLNSLESELNDVAREMEELLSTTKSVWEKMIQATGQEYLTFSKAKRLDQVLEIERKNDPDFAELLAEFARVETDPEIYREAIRVLSALTGLELSGDYDKKDETIEKVKPAVEKDWDASRSDDDKERN